MGVNSRAWLERINPYLLFLFLRRLTQNLSGHRSRRPTSRATELVQEVDLHTSSRPPQLSSNTSRITHVASYLTLSKHTTDPTLSTFQKRCIKLRAPPDGERVAPRTNTIHMWSCAKVQVNIHRCFEDYSRTSDSEARIHL